MEVMVNGLPGKMATKVADYIENSKDMKLTHYSITGPVGSHSFNNSFVGDKKRKIKLINCENKDFAIKNHKPNIVVDYTLPNAVNENADFYCRYNLPFVMGTTGGNREILEERVKDSDICAIVAPNMAKQIVAFQAMMKYAAENFPNAFSDYNLKIIESHQKGKADTSGTAKAMVGYFNSLGIPFVKDQIKKIRNPKEQLEMGVPQDALQGHGWHTYQTKSKDGNVFFEFKHNVNGRDIYALGTLDALEYLDKKMEEGKRGKVYSMIDVLKG